jgi:hypothetical protein
MVEKQVLLAGVALLGLAMVLPDGEACAAKKEKIKAKIANKGFKANLAPAIVGAYDQNTGILTLSGLYQKITPHRGQIKTLLLSCLVDLQTLPATGNCVSQYSSNVYSGFIPGTPTAWAGEGVTVTVKSLDGTRVTGTFEGTIPGSGDTAAASVKGGKFSVDLDTGA